MDTETSNLLFYLIIWIVIGGGLGRLIDKKDPVRGFVLGFLLGIFGWIVSACMQSSNPQTNAQTCVTNNVYANGTVPTKSTGLKIRPKTKPMQYENIEVELCENLQNCKITIGNNYCIIKTEELKNLINEL